VRFIHISPSKGYLCNLFSVDSIKISILSFNYSYLPHLPRIPHTRACSVSTPRARRSSASVCLPAARGPTSPFLAALVAALQLPPRSPVPARRRRAPSPLRSSRHCAPPSPPLLAAFNLIGRWTEMGMTATRTTFCSLIPPLASICSLRRFSRIRSSMIPREVWRRWISTPKWIFLTWINTNKSTSPHWEVEVPP
jgi:hypothetical protein